jgi:hypothetical protein
MPLFERISCGKMALMMLLLLQGEVTIAAQLGLKLDILDGSVFDNKVKVHLWIIICFVVILETVLLFQ